MALHLALCKVGLPKPRGRFQSPPSHTERKNLVLWSSRLTGWTRGQAQGVTGREMP